MNPTGLLTSKTDANAKTVTHTYNAAGQPYQRTWARGVVTTYAYSATTGEQTSITYSDGTPSVTFTYNRLGRQATVADYTGTRTFTYNLSGTLELQNEVLPSAYFGDRRITRGHDTSTSGALGRYNRLGVGPAAGIYSEIDQPFGFDAYGRFNSIGYTTHTYTYATNSHLLASIAHTSSGWTQTRTYLANADVVDVMETKYGATTKAKFDYTHDNLYRVITSAKTGEMFNTYGNGTQGLETDYAYDDKSQLTADSTTLGGSSTPLNGRDDYHAYDPIGNRTAVNRSGTTLTFTSNNLNQYTSFTGSATHTYDHDGNLTSDGQWNYTWDAENRLIAQETASGVTPAKKLEFKYDYQKRRVRKTYYTWGGGAWVVDTDLKFIHDGPNTVLEINASTFAKVRAHVWGLDLSNTLHGAGGVGGLLYTYDYGTSTTYLPAYDGNGNILNYVNASTGAIAQKYEYDAFGQTIVSTGSAAASTPFRFATNYTDTETGLVNNKTRLYLPSLGRFLNRDTIGERGGLHLYAYVTNNPANLYDPFGRDAAGKKKPAKEFRPGVFNATTIRFGNSSSGGSGGGSGGSIATSGHEGQPATAFTIYSGPNQTGQVLMSGTYDQVAGAWQVTGGNTPASGPAPMFSVGGGPRSMVGGGLLRSTPGAANRGIMFVMPGTADLSTGSLARDSAIINGSDTILTEQPSDDIQPDSPAASYVGAINYAAAGALLTYGRFEGEVTNSTNPSDAFLITGSLYGIGYQLGTINGTSDILLRQSPNDLLGVANGGFFNTTVSANAGFVSFGSVSQTVFMNNGTQDTMPRIDFDRPRFQIPSDTKLNDPKDIFSPKPGVGISSGFNGIVIERAIRKFVPPPPPKG